VSDGVFRTDDEMEVADELRRATDKFGPFASAHEGLAVIEEEFLEFRSAVFWGVDQRGRPCDPRSEAIQLAAMALRYLRDIPEETPPEQALPAFVCGSDQ
jgi:hypothetical protein